MKFVFSRYPGALLLAGVLAAGSLPAAAEEVSGQLEEVVVTARKRAENLQEVPVAVTALNARMIRETFATDLAGVSEKIPNVVLDPAPAFANAAAFSIRGISFQDPSPSLEPAVGVVLDGVFLGKAAAALLDVYDLESIEVLRGPQGTLFGKNTIAGVVNVRTKRPTGEFHAGAQLTVGNYGRADVHAFVDLPINGDALAVRFSYLSKHMDGYFTDATLDNRQVGAERVQAGRASIVFRPTDNLDITAVADVVRNTGDPSPQNNGSPPDFVLSQLGLPADNDGDLFKVHLNRVGFTSSTSTGLALEANLKLPTHVVTSVFGYRHIDDRTSNDLSGTPVDFFLYDRQEKIRQISEELRVTSTWSDTIDYVAGLMFFRQAFVEPSTEAVDCNGLGLCPAPVPIGRILIPLDILAAQEGNTYAAFAQGNYHVTKDLRVTVGGRYNHESKTFRYNPPGYTFAPVGSQPLGTGNASFSNFSPRFGLDYKLAPHIMLFGSYAKGFKAGGFNARASSIAGIGPYKDEKVTSIEGGIKSDWLDERLRANVTLFHNDYKQLQVEVIVPSSVGPGQETLVKNAGDAYTEGLEFEFTAAPVEGLQLNANVGYLKARYTSFFADVFGTGTAADNTFLELRRAPKWTIDTGFTYDRPVGEYGKLIFGGDVNHTTHYQTDVTNDTFALRPTATLLNANIAYEPVSGTYRVAIFGKNLTDRRFINNGINAGRLFAFNEPNRPRTFGVEVEVKF